MIQFLGLDNYSSDMLIYVFIAIAVGGAIVGYVTDAVMGDRGFGPWGNAILAILGAFVGLYVRHTYFGALQRDELLVTGVAAGAMATLLLLLLGLAKHFMQD